MASLDQALAEVSFTAKLAAHCRALSDIPYAAHAGILLETKDLFEATMTAADIPMDVAMWMVPPVEARHKSLAAAIKQSGVKQVLELGCGLSLRGLEMTEADHGIIYVATDLPAMMESQRALVARTRCTYSLAEHDRLRFAAVNALIWDEIALVLDHFDKNLPVAVINEGVLTYFHREEQALFATHCRRVLQRFGGVWLTPDFDHRPSPTPMNALMEASRRFTRFLSSAAQRDLDATAFADDHEVHLFTRQLGLSLLERPMLLDINLSTLGIVPGISVDLTRQIFFSRLRLWQLCLAP